MLLSSAVQPSIISLFSSTSSEPLSLFSLSTDQALPSDSFVHLLQDRYSSPLPDSPKTLLHLPAINENRGPDEPPRRGIELDQTVLHIQSPTIRTTYVQCPRVFPPYSDIGMGARSAGGLGIKHPWMHIQVRNLGREWSFEVGVVDHAGRTGSIRFSTFQKKPCLKTNHQDQGSTPLLLLPLSFPSSSTHLLTSWSTINVHLPSLLPYFSSPALRSFGLNHANQEDVVNEDIDTHSRQWGLSSRPTTHTSSSTHGSLPSGTYSHVSYVRVYANCRLRRIWFGESGPSQKVPWEFELYSGRLD